MGNTLRNKYNNKEYNQYPVQHSLVTSVFLHLIPGVVLTGILILLAPAFKDWGLPTMLALIIAYAFIVLPLMIGIMFYHARSLSPSQRTKIVSFREKIGVRTVLSYSGILLIWAVLVFALLAPFSELIKQTLFFWVPEWLNFGDYVQSQDSYSGHIITLTWILALFWTSIAAPVVEELYFRGFLLPAINRYGNWAPLINTVLFALYHFWSLWLLPFRIIALLPMVYVVWIKRSVYIGILVHVLLNLIGDSILTIPYVFGLH